MSSLPSLIDIQSVDESIIQRLLSLIPQRDQWCVEFGAWDGFHLSNTSSLLKSGYRGVLIEADKKKFSELKNNCSSRNVIALHQRVGFQDHDNLDTILSTTPIPNNFDFLSIDIDGFDYHVWEACKVYRPKIVCIEFNPTMPNSLNYIQPLNENIQTGSSPLALVDLGNRMGYSLVAASYCNLFFQDNLLESEQHLPKDRSELIEVLQRIRCDQSMVTYLFVGYDGTVNVSGAMVLPWHGIKLNTRRLQTLPKYLRHFPDNYGRCRQLVLRLLQFTRQLLPISS